MKKQRRWIMTHSKSELKHLELSFGGPSQRQAPGTNQRMNALFQGSHWVRGLTPCHAIKEETRF